MSSGTFGKEEGGGVSKGRRAVAIESDIRASKRQEAKTLSTDALRECTRLVRGPMNLSLSPRWIGAEDNYSVV